MKKTSVITLYKYNNTISNTVYHTIRNYMLSNISTNNLCNIINNNVYHFEFNFIEPSFIIINVDVSMICQRKWLFFIKPRLRQEYIKKLYYLWTYYIHNGWHNNIIMIVKGINRLNDSDRAILFNELMIYVGIGKKDLYMFNNKLNYADTNIIMQRIFKKSPF